MMDLEEDFEIESKRLSGGCCSAGHRELCLFQLTSPFFQLQEKSQVYILRPWKDAQVCVLMVPGDVEGKLKRTPSHFGGPRFQHTPALAKEAVARIPL